MSRLLILLLISSVLSACGASMAGNWEASGHTGVADRFGLGLKFQGSGANVAVFSTEDGGERPVPVCNIEHKDDGTVAFVVDTQPSNTCQALRSPLRFEGELGDSVMWGRILNPDGGEVGIWRAFKKPN